MATIESQDGSQEHLRALSAAGFLKEGHAAAVRKCPYTGFIFGGDKLYDRLTCFFAFQTMRNELNKLVQQVPSGPSQTAFALEMDGFYRMELRHDFSLFTRYLSERAKGTKLNWKEVHSPGPEQIKSYKDLPKPADDINEFINKLAVLKLNGGLGTTMGCVGPKRYPPGHGDLFEALANSGTLDDLIEQGKEYLFVSNVDNLGATVDLGILHHMASSQSEFIMELTDKTKADIKGGTLIDYNGSVRLLEIAQVPPEHVDDFKSVKKFRYFNTNNLWISLKAIKRVVDNNELAMEIIVNNKTADNGEKVIQLETAVGAAIKHFNGAHGVNVPRSRFLPVKSTSDLFLITSDLYKLNHGELTMNPKRIFNNVPLIKLGDHFKKVAHFQARFQGPPHILELDHLTVTGDITFGHDVVLQGTVIIVANHGERIDIPSGSILNDKVVSGNLRILDH
ncbi:UTP-glucose-1-phosphate uridylyltransferase [Borealophlyctis nickersoniae]|nr:UTP-glucose-1-phosphate uridylyltransferase [Borealophlyctis nickersoniae]